MADRDVGQLYRAARTVLFPTFNFLWDFHFAGLEHVPTDGPAIFCPNHTSVLDSFFLPLGLARRITYVGKAEYMDDWKTRKLFPALGMIPIDRSGGNASERALDAATGLIEAGEYFGIYPEGTRSRTGQLFRGHTGPARLALRTGAPLIPVGIRGSREVMPPEAKFPRLFRPVSIRFGRPIRVQRYEGRTDDHLVLREITDELMYEIRSLSGQEYIDRYATRSDRALVVAHTAQIAPGPPLADTDLARAASA